MLNFYCYNIGLSAFIFTRQVPFFFFFFVLKEGELIFLREILLVHFLLNDYCLVPCGLRRFKAQSSDIILHTIR